MISYVIGLFFLLLIIGVPVAHLVMGSAAFGIVMNGSSPVIMVQQLYEGLNSSLLLAIPFFIISGDIAAKGNTSEKIVDVINAFLGRVRGGLGIATIFACTFFGAITGSAIATVVAIGALMVPKLLERNYPKLLVIGIITTAGTLGVMIPPSIPMLMISVAMRTSVGKQFTAGFIPGIVIALGFSLYVWWVARKQGIPLEAKKTFQEKMHVVKESSWALMFPVVVLGGIYSGLTTPTEASVISLVYVLLVELLIYKKLSAKEIFEVIGKSTVDAATLTLTVATAQVFVWYMTTAQVPAMLYNSLTSSISNRYGILFGLSLLFFIVGCFTNVTTVVIIIGPMLLPVLNYFGIDLIHFGIIAMMMSQIGFVTPPFGICLFVSMKVVKASMVEVTKGSIPFLLIMLLLTILFILVPQISTWLPNLIFA